MATLRELKTRIGSVASTEKITGAMKMISSAKVHQNEQALRRLQPFRNQLEQIMGHILATDIHFASPLIEAREVKKATLVVFGSDDGLCGAYNINILKGVLENIDKLRDTYGTGVEIEIVAVGDKIAKAVRRLALPGITLTRPEGVNSKMDGTKVNEFTETLRRKFISGEADLVEVIYMRFYSMSRQRLVSDRLFPVNEETLLKGKGSGKDENQLYIFEPDANSIFNEVLPMVVLSMMQEITIENRASEQAARVMAMQTANDNAKKLIDELQLEYNKLRQQSITTELLDILGGQTESRG